MSVCVNTSSKEFKDASKRLNISEGSLENIVHEFMNTEGNENSFPSDSYILSKVEGQPFTEPLSKKAQQLVDLKYSKPITVDSYTDAQAVMNDMAQYFDPKHIGIKETLDGRYEISLNTKVLPEQTKEQREQLSLTPNFGAAATAAEVYKQLMQQYTPDSSEGKLATLVFNTLANTDIEFRPSDSIPEGIAGKFVASENAILYNSKGILDNTLLHEAIHAVTVYYLGATNTKGFSKEVQAAIKEINECYDLLKQDFIDTHFKENGRLKEGINVEAAFAFHTDNQDLYGLTNAKELVAEITNPGLLTYIRDFDARHKGQNIFQRLVDAIAGLLGINKSYGSLEKTLKDALVTLIKNPSNELMGRYALENQTVKENYIKLDKLQNAVPFHNKKLIDSIPDFEGSEGYEMEFVIPEDLVGYSFNIPDGTTHPLTESPKGAVLVATDGMAKGFLLLNGEVKRENGTVTIPVKVIDRAWLSVHTFDIFTAPNGVAYVDNVQSLFSDRKSLSEDEQAGLSSVEPPQVRPELQRFQNETSTMVSQLTNLLDSDLMSNTEVRHVAEQAVYFISDSITEFLENPIKVFDAFPELAVKNGEPMTDAEKQAETEKLKGMSRVDLAKYISPERLIEFTKVRLFTSQGNPNINNRTLVKKAKLIRDNFGAIIRFANDAFAIVEDFAITSNGERMSINEDMAFTEEDFNNTNDADAILENEGSLQEHWQIESRTLDVLTSMSQLVKQTLNKCFQVRINPETGEEEHVPSEFGIAERVNAKDATASILRWTKGAESLTHMVELLKAKSSENPWINQIIAKLEDMSGNESDFQSQFYGVFAKAFQPYSVVLKEKNTQTGEFEYKSIQVNQHPALTDAVQGIEVAYKTNNHPLFDNGKIRSDALDTLTAIAYQLVEKAQYTLEENNKQELVDLLYKAANVLGYNPDINVVSVALDSTDTFHKMVNNIKSISDNLNKALNQENYDPFKYGAENSIGGFLRKFLKPLTDSLEDTAISSFYDSGKMYQSYVTPSYLTVMMNHFTSEDARFQEWLNNEYGAYEWFKNPDGTWRNVWLETLDGMSQEDRKNLFKHKVQLNFNKHNYMRNMSDVEYGLSVLSEYFSELGNAKGTTVPVWYRVPMMSNKPSSEFIRMNAYTGSMMKYKLTEGFSRVFQQELSRIQTVSIRDYNKKDAAFIKSFDKNGKKFMMLSFFNKYLEGGKEYHSELGRLIHKAIEQGTSYDAISKKGLTAEENARMTELVNDEVVGSMDAIADNVINTWKSNGIFEGAKQIANIGKEDETVESKLREFVWNDTFAAMNILELTITDPAFYKDAEDLQKRLAQIHAPGIRANVEATDYKGNRVTDGKFRTLLLTDFDDFISNIKDNLRIVFDKKLKEFEDAGISKDDSKYKAASATYENIIEQFNHINVADAQGYSSPTSYRKKAFIFGKWSRKSEDIYKKLKAGNYNYSDLQTAFQPLKPFVYGQIAKPATQGLVAPLTQLKVPVQFKNSEYLLIMADAILQGEDTGKPNLLRAVYEVMEESAEGDITKGIDTIQFESTCKSGLTGAVNIKQYYDSPAGEALAKRELINAIYNADGTYNNIHVYEVPFENYAIQQEVPEHFKNHFQAHGSQIRYIIPSDLEIEDSDGNPVTYDYFDRGELKRLNARDFRTEYEENISQNIEESIKELAEKVGIGNEFLSKKDRNIALSEILLDEILSSPRYGAELAAACTVNSETGEFNIPLGDPIQSKRIEQLINSVVKNRINKQEIAGGPVVQVTNFGTSKQLNIRFNGKDGNLLMTRAEFEKSGREGTFEDYIKENQAGIAYYEVFAPIFSNELFERFADKNGNIDIEAIERVNPDLLKMIGYRIPTEDKYSMAPLKIVGFLPREAGDGIMLPNDITLLTGSDFDVDKFYLMRKEIFVDRKSNKEIRKTLYNNMDESYKDSYSKRAQLSEDIETFLDNPSEMKKAGGIYNKLWELYIDNAFEVTAPTEGTIYRNNKIVDMSWAVLTNETTASKMLTPGGFEPEKRMGYLISAYQNPANNLTWEQLNAIQDIDELKSLCYTDKNLCFIDTHLQFYRQNSAAATALGMAAVQKVAHAVMESDGFYINVSSAASVPRFSIAGKEFSQFMEIDAKYNDEGALIGRTLGEFVAMFADAVKDPVANLMNINNTTMPIVTSLIRLGMPFEKAALYIAQPVIKRVLDLYNSENVTNFVRLSDIIQRQLDAMAKRLNVEEDSHINELVDISEEELIKYLNPAESADYFDYKVLRTFQFVNDIAQTLKSPTYATRFNSISNAVGPLVIDNLIMEYKADEGNFDNFFLPGIDEKGEQRFIHADFMTVLSKHPILNSFYKTLDISRILLDDMPANSFNFRDMLKSADSDLKKSLFGDRKTLSELSDFYQSYLLVASGAIPVEATPENKYQGLKYYIEQFPQDFIRGKAKEVFKGNPLIDAIKLDVQKGRAVLKIDTVGLTTQDKERLGDGWADLYKSGERGKKLAEHLFYYNFWRTGIGFSPKSFMGLFPTRLKSKIPGYNEAFIVHTNKFAKNVNGFNVLSQFIRNNADNNKIAPKIKVGKEGTNPSTIKDDAGNIVAYVFSGKDYSAVKNKAYIKIKSGGKDILLERYGESNESKKNQIAHYRILSLLGNNGEYFEASTNKAYKPLSETTETKEQKNEGQMEEVSGARILVDDIPAATDNPSLRVQADRATRIRNKLLEMFQSTGRTAEQAQAEMDRFKAKPGEEKQGYRGAMKKFIANKLEKEGIKYNDALLEEMFNELC